MLIYIAGPYSNSDPAKVEANVMTAIDAGNALLDKGHDVIVPHLSHYMHMRKPRHWREWMRNDMRLLAKCDAILLVGDWGTSNGACAEWAVVASSAGKGTQIYYSVVDVPMAIGSLPPEDRQRAMKPVPPMEPAHVRE